jgi:hypothetical protein
MAVQCNIAALNVQNTGNQRSAIKVLTPVLEQNVRFLISQNFNSLPDCHPLFEVLLFNLGNADRLDRTLY